MGNQQSDSGDGGDELQSEDYSRLILSLIRSGQVQLVRSGDGINFDYIDESESDEEEGKEEMNNTEVGNKKMDINDLEQHVKLASGQILPLPNSISPIIQQRQQGLRTTQGFKARVLSRYLPNNHSVLQRFRGKAFCGQFSSTGEIFMSACQDCIIRLYDVTDGKFSLFKSIGARDVGWSIIDTDFSPDQRHVIYSSWCDCLHLCSIRKENDLHLELDMRPTFGQSFCAFSIKFSHDSTEILAGSNCGYLYIFDMNEHQRTLEIQSHEDDVNAVKFADASSQIFFSGGDDAIVKVWDRRTLSESNPVPVGAFGGHTDGITYIDSKNDGRYLISNSKDQCIKLWDMRYFSGREGVEESRRAAARQGWDYRWQSAPRRRRKRKHKHDASLMTYQGHGVANTLIRSFFSPMHSTGQAYIYTGSCTGSVFMMFLLVKFSKILTDIYPFKKCFVDFPSILRIIFKFNFLKLTFTYRTVVVCEMFRGIRLIIKLLLHLGIVRSDVANIREREELLCLRILLARYENNKARCFRN
ncbi:DDB1- and CUL4-associated factor 11 [Trichoplax sp. H2]|nr:DDB1- and CUL4-associated factor 11 [Trichoplax sp. H2]|eukprot:RDD36705.1 DDB1- and CUL4-associated factor 11 [Trichoplax sp. H2]